MPNDDHWITGQTRVKQGQRVPREDPRVQERGHRVPREDPRVQERGHRVPREQPRPATSPQGSTTDTPAGRPTRDGGHD